MKGLERDRLGLFPAALDPKGGACARGEMCVCVMDGTVGKEGGETVGKGGLHEESVCLSVCLVCAVSCSRRRDEQRLSSGEEEEEITHNNIQAMTAA